MRSEYPSDELLALSGIQHFCFCRRQWALIHIEQQWQENILTVEGRILHNRVHDSSFQEVRNGVIISRALPVASYHLGLYGICDVVEFSPSVDGVTLHGRYGKYLPMPVEYKRGKEKVDRSDQAQLCAQVICLEEMFAVNIPYAYLYYGETRHRVGIEMTNELRNIVIDYSKEMHSYFERGYTPRVKPSKACKSCSLKDLCLPSLQEKLLPASKYIQNMVNGE